jgi:MYXO-CTERM domain-containing protein
MRAAIRIACLTAAAVALCASAHAATNLIQDGDFSSPNQGGGYSVYSPGINGWLNTNGDGIEIGNTGLYGLPCDNGACQNLEVNANTFDTDIQTVSGLTVGETYRLSWDYGGRPGGGPQQLNVSFGGNPLTSDSGSFGSWTTNSFIIVATSTSETLQFQSIDVGGLPSYGNEITNVSLTAAPEASTWAMLLAGFGGLAAVGYRRRAALAA